MKIQLVKESDAQKMLEVALEAFAEDAEKYGSPPPKIDTLEWRHPRQYNGIYYKLLLEDEIIGGFRIINKGDGHYYFASAFITPQYQNRGYGSEVMKFIDKEFSNVKKWTLDTPYKSYRNHYFYEKHGFVKHDEVKPVPKNDFTLFLYEKIM